MTVTMKGKERDIELANQLREEFIKRYANNDRAIQELLESLGVHTLDRLIHRLKIEKTINLYRDYKELREIASETQRHSARKVFEGVSKVDEARAWINDNGKYTELVFEALYDVFKQDARLEPLVEDKIELSVAE